MGHQELGEDHGPESPPGEEIIRAYRGREVAGRKENRRSESSESSEEGPSVHIAQESFLLRSGSLGSVSFRRSVHFLEL